ncbi:MAG: hypothetical protein DRQ40_09490, partial [Gammaproteobacteria bacterium]
MTLRATHHYIEVAGIGDSDIQVTRQYVEVAGIGESKIRNSQFYVEVLSHTEVTYTESVEHDLSLYSNFTTLRDYRRTITDDSSLSQDVSRFRMRIAHDLGLSAGPYYMLAAGDF